MGNEIKYLKTKNEEFPYVYSLNVMEALQNEYGSLENWSNLIEPKDGSEPKIKAMLFFFKEAINEGIDIENENKHEERNFINEKKVGRIISELGIEEIVKQLKNVVVEASGTNSENNSKNVIPTQNR